MVDAYACDREFIASTDRGVAAWVGFGERECRMLVDDSVSDLADAAFTLLETIAPRQATLVLDESQSQLEHVAAERRYTELGVRLVFARRLAVLHPLKEVVAVQAEIARPR